MQGLDFNTLLLAALLVQLSRLVPILRGVAVDNGRRLMAIMKFFGIVDPAALPPSSPSSPPTQAPTPALPRARDAVATDR